MKNKWLRIYQVRNLHYKYDDKYYSVSRGKVTRIVEKYDLAYIGGIPFPLNDLERNIIPNKNGYIHWKLK